MTGVIQNGVFSEAVLISVRIPGRLTMPGRKHVPETQWNNNPLQRILSLYSDANEKEDFYVSIETNLFITNNKWWRIRLFILPSTNLRDFIYTDCCITIMYLLYDTNWFYLNWISICFKQLAPFTHMFLSGVLQWMTTFLILPISDYITYALQLQNKGNRQSNDVVKGS